MSLTCSIESLRFWFGEPGSSEQEEMFNLDPLDVADRLNVLESDNYTLSELWWKALAGLHLKLDSRFLGRVIDSQLPREGVVDQRQFVRGLAAELGSANSAEFPYAEQLRNAAVARFSPPDCGIVALAVAIKEAAKFGETLVIKQGQVKRISESTRFSDSRGVLGVV